MGNRRWPLLVIAAPAAVAIWSGWVGLGGLCGFGLVQPLPGIVAWHLNTAITLPVGMEAYAVFALGVWLAPETPLAARRFAQRSAVGALILGMTGQVIYHLLAAAHAHAAPWPVTVLVACLPVAVLGCAAALTHLLRVPAGEPVPVSDGVAAAPRPAPAPRPRSSPDRDTPALPAASNGYSADAHRVMDECGPDASLRTIQGTLACGQARAQRVQAEVREMRALAGSAA